MQKKRNEKKNKRCITKKWRRSKKGGKKRIERGSEKYTRCNLGRQLAEEARLKKEQQDREKEMEELKQIELKFQQEREEKAKAKQREAADIQVKFRESVRLI